LRDVNQLKLYLPFMKVLIRERWSGCQHPGKIEFIRSKVKLQIKENGTNKRTNGK